MAEEKTTKRRRRKVSEDTESQEEKVNEEATSQEDTDLVTTSVDITAASLKLEPTKTEKQVRREQRMSSQSAASNQPQQRVNPFTYRKIIVNGEEVLPGEPIPAKRFR